MRWYHEPFIVQHRLARERTLHVLHYLGQVEGEKRWLCRKVHRAVFWQFLCHVLRYAVHLNALLLLSAPSCGDDLLAHCENLPVGHNHCARPPVLPRRPCTNKFGFNLCRDQVRHLFEGVPFERLGCIAFGVIEHAELNGCVEWDEVLLVFIGPSKNHAVFLDAIDLQYVFVTQGNRRRVGSFHHYDFCWQQIRIALDKLCECDAHRTVPWNGYNVRGGVARGSRLVGRW